MTIDFSAEFYGNPQDFILRCHEGRVTAEKKGIWTWLRAHVFYCDQYKLPAILNALAQVDPNRNEYAALKGRIDIDKYLSKHPDQQHIRTIFQEIICLPPIGGEIFAYQEKMAKSLLKMVFLKKFFINDEDSQYSQIIDQFINATELRGEERIDIQIYNSSRNTIPSIERARLDCLANGCKFSTYKVDNVGYFGLKRTIKELSFSLACLEEFQRLSTSGTKEELREFLLQKVISQMEIAVA